MYATILNHRPPPTNPYYTHPQPPTTTAVLQNCKKSAVTHPIEKPILLNLLNLSTIFCPMLTEETYFHL